MAMQGVQQGGQHGNQGKWEVGSGKKGRRHGALTSPIWLERSHAGQCVRVYMWYGTESPMDTRGRAGQIKYFKEISPPNAYVLQQRRAELFGCCIGDC